MTPRPSPQACPHVPLRSCLLLALLITAVAVSSTLAQVAVVTQPVHLRVDPSTNHQSLRLIVPPERLQLIPPKEEGDFYHVRTNRDETGWVWKRNISVYHRDGWMRGGRWKDADSDCQTTRHEGLIEESTITVTLASRGCVVLSGSWQDPYSGEVISDPADLDIDHLIRVHLRVYGLSCILCGEGKPLMELRI